MGILLSENRVYCIRIQRAGKGTVRLMIYKATVVIPNLNGAGWLRQSIESVWAQTEQQFELIVVDNGSTDQSLTDARSYCGRENYTLIENGTNTGFSHAVNQGIAAAKAPYVVLFNNDAFAEPEWLRELLRTADADSRIFAVQSLMIRHWERHLADDAGDYVAALGWPCKRGDGMRVERYTKPCRIFSACGGAALYRKSLIEEFGSFEEAFFAYYEDVDISWRANSLGYKNVFCPTSRCYHICGATTGGEKGAKYNDFKAIQSGRNTLLLVYKNMPLVMWLLNMVFLVPGYLIKCLFFTLRGYGKPWFQGMREAFGSFSKMKKIPFRWKNLPNYLLIEVWMIADCFRYAAYRIGRALKIT